jgi:outer membrane protein assembly factor BamB
VIATDGTIYFGSHDGILYALHPDGSLKWTFDAAGGPISSAPVLAADDTIYFVNDTALMALSPDGKLLAHSPSTRALFLLPRSPPTEHFTSRGRTVELSPSPERTAAC